MNEEILENENLEDKSLKSTKIYRKFAKIKRRLLSRHLRAVRISLLFSAILVCILIAYLLGNLLQGTIVDRALRVANAFLFTPEGIVEQYETRTNVLILGKAGEGHIAPELTDTIIVASIKSSDPQEIDLISVPRDIWVPDLEAKINSAYYWGNKRKPGGGLVLAKSAVSDVVGIPIHYAVVFDFGQFEKIIDKLGGINVLVEKTFTDTRFPIPGKENDECDGDPDYNCRYETITFKEGTMYMDGTTALKFVRSRHSEDLEEGTDLARAKRQQNVIAGIKDRLLSREILSQPRLLWNLAQSTKNDIETDLSDPQIAYLARRALQTDSKIETNVVPEDLLYNPPLQEEYDFLYVFIPPQEYSDWTPVHHWVKDIFSR